MHDRSLVRSAVLVAVLAGCSGSAEPAACEAPTGAAVLPALALVVPAELRAQPGACGSNCAPVCSGTSDACDCTQACPADHDRRMTCDRYTCICMLDDREVAAFPASASCASTESMVDAFVQHCGASLPPPIDVAAPE